jgi:hypothetical protein
MNSLAPAQGNSLIANTGDHRPCHRAAYLPGVKFLSEFEVEEKIKDALKILVALDLCKRPTVRSG